MFYLYTVIQLPNIYKLTWYTKYTDIAILLDNAAELRVKIEDLENNIELLTNNLTDENKELISDSESEN